ncbi:hypothetical protein ACQ4PT_018678 [Festuca glaucescens]
MAATARDVRAAHVPDEVSRWWDTFKNGVLVDEQYDEVEPGVDSDSDFEQVAQEEEQNAGVEASESDGKMLAAAHARVEEQGSGGAARHGDEEEVSQDGNVQTQRGFLLGRKRKAIATRSKPEATETEIHGKNRQEEEVSQDGNVQTQRGFLLGRKRKAIATRSKPEATETEIHGKNRQGESLRAENEILRLQIVQKTKELEAEQIRRLELELLLKNKENKSLKKQNKALRAENEHYKKTNMKMSALHLIRSVFYDIYVNFKVLSD